MMSAWRSFFVAVEQHRVDTPDNDDLWPLLVTMTLRKLSRQTARHTADRRAITAESAVEEDHWREIVARDPTPVEAAMVTDELESLMSRLSQSDREILTRRLQGEDLTSIANSLDCSDRTVRRSLHHIREQFVQQRRIVDPTSKISVSDGLDALTTRPNVSPTYTASSVPTITFDQILLQELVGQGAFGKVYRSLYRPTGSAVAVKFLKRHLWQNHRAVHQLIREFELVSEIHHPGIIGLQGWGRTPHGSPFVVMEWIDGLSLQQWKQSTHLSGADVVQCGLAICEAVAVAHEHRIIHGDLTPNNILRASTDRFVLTDFGFSQLAGLPIRDTIGGSPGYLAPEQFSDVFGTVNAQTDVFGLGGILYFLLTGQPPVTGRSVPEVLARTLSASAIKLVTQLRPRVTDDLSQLVHQCLQKEPAERPETIRTAQQKLQRIADLA
ncbi:MAG: protein kinase [Planctomycetaceae bacterium]